MKRILRPIFAAVLTLALASPLSAQTPGPQVHTGLPSSHIVMPLTHVIGGEIDSIRADQSVINPPSAVKQPGSRTRLIVAMAFVGGLAVLAAIICSQGGCGSRS